MNQIALDKRKIKSVDGAVRRRKVITVITVILLTFFSFVMLYPLIFMVLIGLFSREELALTTIGLFPWPENIYWYNYLLILSFPYVMPNFGWYLFNTVARTILGVIASCLTTLICGYTFSKIKFRGNRNLLLFLVMTTFLPGSLTLIPTFLIFLNFPFGGATGIYDTWWVYVIGLPGINIMGTFVVKQFMDTLPSSLEESAKIDGAGTLRIIFTIIFPLCLPIMAFIAIGAAMGGWNDWGTAFFFTEGGRLNVLAGAIASQVIGNHSGMRDPDYPGMVAIGMVLTIPSLLLFLFFQRYIIEGIANTGIKG